MYKFYSIEECLLRLGNKRCLIQVNSRDGEVEYDLIPFEGYNPTHRLRGFQSLYQYLISSIKETGSAIFGYHPEYNEIYSYVSCGEVGLVCFEKTELIKDPSPKNPLPIIRFSNETVCGSYPEYLSYFGLEDTYTNRGKVLTLATNLAKTSDRGTIVGTHQYDRSLVEQLYYGTSRFGKNVPVLRYRGLSDIFGFTNIIKIFPNMTQEEIVELFESYSIPLPSTAEKYLRELSKGESPSTRPPRKKKSTQVENLDLIQYIGKHHIKKSRKKVVIYSHELDSEIVAKDPFDLIQTIRANGDNIDAEMGPKLWEEVTGKSWESKGGLN